MSNNLNYEELLFSIAEMKLKVDMIFDHLDIKITDQQSFVEHVIDIQTSYVLPLLKEDENQSDVES